MSEWKTIQECFEENGSIFPFVIENKTSNLPFLDRLILKNQRAGYDTAVLWETANYTHWIQYTASTAATKFKLAKPEEV